MEKIKGFSKEKNKSFIDSKFGVSGFPREFGN
jgi:hypothetical protein